jgi:aldehyde dehydrogenase (NAD+)
VERALKFARLLEAGAVGLNCSAPTQALDMPVSGWKQSGIGSEMHLYGVNNYLQTKAVYMKYADVPMH